MLFLSRRTGTPRRNDQGAAAVEFALLFPLFLMLVVGMISAGFAFERWISVTQGAREAARFGATLSVTAAGGTAELWLDTVSDRAIAAADLAIDPTHAVVGTTVCVGLMAPEGAPAVTRHVAVTTDGTGLISRAYVDGPCPGVSTGSGNYVQVSIARPTDFNYVVANPTIDVTGRGISRFEAVQTS